MTTIPQIVKKRFKKHVGKVQNRIINTNKNRESKEELLSIFKYIARNIFGFNEQTELTDLSISGATYYYLGVKIENEIKYIIEVVSPQMNLKNEYFTKTVEYAIHNHIEWFVRTNGIAWEIYKNRCEQPDEYEKVCTFNLLELNLKNNDDLANLFILCKESHKKKIITDLYNRNCWYGYLSEDKSTIDYMILLYVCLYEDGSEKVHIPYLDVTYWCDQPFVARQNAERAIEKHLKDEYGREFDSEHRFVTIAYHKETNHLKKNVPVWW